MAEKIAKQSMAAFWLQQSGPFTASTPFQLGQAGMGDITLPGPGGRTILYGTNAMGLPIALTTTRAAPGQPSVTLENYLTVFRDAIQKMRETGQVRNLQLRIHDGTPLDNPSLWSVIVHLEGGQAGDSTIGAPVSREFGDAVIPQSTPYTPFYGFIWIKQALTRLTTTEVGAANGVAFLSEPESFAEAGNGYPGPDKIGYIACDAGVGVTANVQYTITGGSSWAVTSADPFAANEHTNFPVLRVISDTQFRLIVGRITTDAGNPGEIAYADVTIGAEATTTWTAVNVGSTNGSIITAIFWPSFGRLYVADDQQKIWLSTDQGASFTLLYTGSQDFRAFALSPDGRSVYAVGDSNTLVVEKGQSGTFETITGPTGSNNSTAIAVARDTIWLGNGPDIFYSRNLLPTAAGQWTSSKSFGTNHSVKGIHLKTNPLVVGSSLLGSQVMHVLVNDGTTPDGDMWLTNDGGGFWQEITNLANSGYNAAYFSPIDPNLAIIVGEVDTATALIHKLSPGGGV